jgi:hypothetical protein
MQTEVALSCSAKMLYIRSGIAMLAAAMHAGPVTTRDVHRTKEKGTFENSLPLLEHEQLVHVLCLAASFHSSGRAV